MKVKLRHFIFVASLINSPLVAKAELTGNDLLSVCTEIKLACVTYVQGYTVGLEQGAVFGFLYKRSSEGEEAYLGLVDRVVGICTPEAVSNDQLADILIKFLQDNPTTRHESLTTVTYDAFSKAFPCE